MFKNKGVSLKKYSDGEYLLTVYGLQDRLRKRSIKVEQEDEELPWEVEQEKEEVQEDEEEGERLKLINNMARAKSRVFEIAACNSWQWFCTFTIDKAKYDRYNLKKFYKDFSQWVQNYQKKTGLVLAYVFIPELHENGAWHMHGLLSGLPIEHLSPFERGKHPEKLIGSEYFNWSAYADKFGFCSLGKVKDHVKVTKYIIKYIGKGYHTRQKDFGEPLYYCSKGLKRAEVLKKGAVAEFLTKNIPVSFKNDFVKKSWLDDEMLEDRQIAGVLNNIK